MNRTEQEALDNFTARALLMPYHKTVEFLSRTDFINQSRFKRVKIIKEFARQHNVDELQALKRVNEVLAMSLH